MNALAAIEITAALLSLVTRATAVATRITATVIAARREGRDISDGELADLAADSDRIASETLAALRSAAQR